jgi:hypothetical protein
MGMISRDELKEKREADSRVALLGLAADTTGTKQGRCLSSVEMAAFLDGKCELEQKQSYLNHISTCESCYKEWLDLQQELFHDTTVQKKPLLFQRWFLRAGGSLLAAAASVVFYLNLDTGPVSLDVPISTVPQLEMKQTPEMEETPVAPSPVEKSRQQFDRMPATTPEDGVEEKLAVPARQMSLRSEAMAPAMILDLSDQWIELVLKKCSEEKVEQIVWKDLARQGKELPPVDGLFQLKDIVKKVSQISAGEDRESLCAEIKQILKEKNHDPKTD